MEAAAAASYENFSEFQFSFVKLTAKVKLNRSNLRQNH
jgi:hypothetical protein